MYRQMRTCTLHRRQIQSGCGDTPAHVWRVKPSGLVLHTWVHHEYIRKGMKLEIHVVVKSVYGNDLIYVVEPWAAAYISTLTGKKTVTKHDIEALKGLGIEVIHNG
jgi:hypothetical protein